MADSDRIHQEAVVVECHNDLILLVDRGKRFGSFSLKDHWIPQLRTGGVDVQVVPISTEGGDNSPESALRRTLKLVELIHSEVEANPSDVALCRSGDEIDAAVESGKIALVLAFEGSASIFTDVDLISAFHRLGLRMASFSWFGRTMLADGSGEEATGGGLTSSGVNALKEMERLGILMDVSHLSAAGVRHVLEIATRPIIASHSSARALCDHHRNLTDDQLKAIAATGGVIGVNFFPGFIDPENPTIDRIVDHIDHIVQVAGLDHVGIGPDFVKELFDEFYPNYPDLKIEGLNATQTIQGLETAADLPRLTEKLLERGFKEDEIKAVLGGNFLRVFRQVMGVPK
jgi:membrane dipeptidase